MLQICSYLVVQTNHHQVMFNLLKCKIRKNAQTSVNVQTPLKYMWTSYTFTSKAPFTVNYKVHMAYV